MERDASLDIDIDIDFELTEIMRLELGRRAEVFESLAERLVLNMQRFEFDSTAR